MAYINKITVGSVNYDLSLPTQSVGDGLTISTNDADDSSILSVNIGNGLYFNDSKISVKPSSGITCNNNGISLKVNTDTFYFDTDKMLRLNLGNGLMHDEEKGIPRVNLGTGLQFNNNGKICINCGDGLDYYTNTDGNGIPYSQLYVKIGDGLQTETGEITVKLGQGLNMDTNGAICNPIQYGDGLQVDTTDKTLSVVKGRGLVFDDNNKLEIFLDSNYGDGLTFKRGEEHTHLRMRRHISLTMHRNELNDGLLGNWALGVNESWLKQFIQDNFDVTPKTSK